MRFCLNNSNIAIITVKGFHYHSVIHDISKSEALHFFENYLLDDCGYKNKYKKWSLQLLH